MPIAPGRRTARELARALPWLGGLAVALPIVLVRYPPMGDLAMHEAVVSLLRHHGDPAWAPPGLYYVVAPQANQLFHFLACALAFVVSTSLACKLVVAGSVLMAPVGLARWLRRLDASTSPSLLIAPVVCGWMFGWGLVPNLLGFTLLIWSLPLLERLGQRMTTRRVVLASLAAPVVFMAHESSALLFAVVASYLALVRYGGLAALAKRLLPVLVILVLALAQWRVAKALAGVNMQDIGNDYGLGPVERLGILPGAIFGGKDATRLAVLGTVFLAALVASAVARGRPSRRSIAARVALWRHRHAVLALTFFFLYVAFPMSLGGTTLLAHRFLPAACLFLIAACAPAAGGRSWAARVAVVLAIAAPLAVVGTEMKSFADSSRNFTDLDTIIARIPRNVAVAQLDLTPRARSSIAPIPGAGDRTLAERGGRMLFAFTDMPPNPVYIRDDARWNEPIRRIARQPYAFMPAHDAQRFAYLIVRQAQPALDDLMARALAPEEELVVTAGDWMLFRSTLAIDPIDAPDRPLPDPEPEVLAERVDRLAPPRAPRSHAVP